MHDHPKHSGDAETGHTLAEKARLNEIGRRTSVLKFRLGFLRWMVLPVFGLVLVAMMVGLVFGFGEAESLIGGIIGTAGAASGLVLWGRQLQDEAFDLDEERETLLGVKTAPGLVEGMNGGGAL